MRGLVEKTSEGWQPWYSGKSVKSFTLWLSFLNLLRIHSNNARPCLTRQGIRAYNLEEMR